MATKKTSKKLRKATKLNAVKPLKDALPISRSR